MTNKKPFVIAIAAVSGGGKTTITSRLLDVLPNSIAIYFDDYDFEECPEDIVAWVKSGGDPNEWTISPLINDLLKVIHDGERRIDYILMDYPFAYGHKEMKEYIDFAIFIDTPLDIAFVRRILRDFEAAAIEVVRDDLLGYLSHSREAYIHMLKTIKPDSDFIVDGSLSLADIVEILREEIERRVEVNS
ncbi:MAG: hypothetical protein P0Y55_08645 [Candidatus Cohnella colombiensis]|uniref:Phosphoribulokinase/uridine kinase domain-containing protein n=1 Tax=Candidatus Cohnella colombiensis TaxID=3121368 RepID=A0AA95EYY9_9BACL|nr:MAG: hypothetical protein P0Y55_08645 [Cohnella sp.]